MSKTLEQIVEDLNSLTILEMSKLKEMLETKWGVKAAVAAPVSAASEQQTQVAESTEFEVTLEKFADDKKISIIKEVRQITGLGLKEAKELVEAAPKVLKPSCSKAEAEEIAKKIAAAGGNVILKGL